MAQDQITNFADTGALKAQLKELENIAAAAENVFKDAAVTIAEAITKAFSIDGLKASTENMRTGKKALDDVTAAIAEKKRISDQIIITQAKINELDTNNAKLLAEQKTQQAELNRQLTEEAKANNALYQARIKANEAAKEAAKQSKSSSQAAKEEARINAELSSAYTLLSKAAQDATKKYKDYAAELGMKHPVVEQARKDAMALNQTLSKIDQGAGDFRRNVGNYSSAFNGLGVSITQIARELPTLAQSFQMFIMAIGNNVGMFQDEVKKTREQIALLRAEGKQVPGLFAQIAKNILSAQVLLSVGIALLQAYSKEVGETIEMLTGLVKGADATGKSVQVLNSAFKDTSLTEAIKNVSQLKIDIQLAKEGILDKTKVLNEYNTTIGKTTGEVSSLDAAELALGKNADAYIKMTFYKAAANAALEESAKEAVKAQKSQADTYNNVKDAAALPGTAASAIAVMSSGLNALKSESADTASKTFGDIAEGFRKTAAQIARDNNFDLFGGKEDGKKGKAAQDLTNELLAARRKEIEEQRKLDLQRLEDSANYQQSLYEDETQAYEARIHSLNEYTKLREQIVTLNAQAESEEIQISLDKIAEIESKSAAKRTNEEKNLLLNKKNLQIALQRIEEEANTNRNEEFIKGDKERVKIVADLAKQQYNIIQRNLNDIALAGKQSGLSQQDILQNQIGYLNESLQAAGLNTEERKKIAEELTNFQIKQQDIVRKAEEQADKDRERAAKKQQDLLKDLAKSTADAIVSIFTSSIDRQVNSLGKQNDAIAAQKDKEITAIENSALSEEDKNERKIVAEGKARVATEDNEKKIADLKRKAAIADKAAAIAKIIAATAIAEVQALSFLSNPITAPFYPGIAATIAAIGAAQLATTLAQPIPEYAEGTEDHPGGRAIVGDGGKPELIIEPGKKPYLSPDTDTIVDLPKHTQVIPLQKLRTAGDIFNQNVKVDNRDVIRAVAAIGDQISGVIKKKGTSVVVVNNRSSYDARRASARA